MKKQKLLYKSSRRLGPAESGALVDVTPRAAGWKYIRFTVRRVAKGDALAGRASGEEACLVLLQGSCRVSWDGGRAAQLGPRASVFESYPHALYVPNGHAYELTADSVCEVAIARAPSKRRDLEPRVVQPEDCGFEIRGGGNATRQIVDILPPSFPADRLMLCEVFTPSGNWSSYPPHKHDQDKPPLEADLEETYYYRMSDPLGYGLQRLYTADGRTDETLKVDHGDLVLVREGYHPFVSAFGFDSYYLNVLAGERRSMAASDDPRYAPLRKAWPPADPRMPVIPKPAPVNA
jgi:5-deoxy-glucuronate isomerase